MNDPIATGEKGLTPEMKAQLAEWERLDAEDESRRREMRRQEAETEMQDALAHVYVARAARAW